MERFPEDALPSWRVFSEPDKVGCSLMDDPDHLAVPGVVGLQQVECDEAQLWRPTRVRWTAWFAEPIGDRCRGRDDREGGGGACQRPFSANGKEGGGGHQRDAGLDNKAREEVYDPVREAQVWRGRNRRARECQQGDRKGPSGLLHDGTIAVDWARRKDWMAWPNEPVEGCAMVAGWDLVAPWIPARLSQSDMSGAPENIGLADLGIMAQN